MMKIKKIAALSIAAVTMLTSGFLCGNVSDSVMAADVDAQDPIDVNGTEDFTYVVENGKIRFTGNVNSYLSYIVSSNLDYTMERETLQTTWAPDDDDYVFTPAKNGRYVISVESLKEAIIETGEGDYSGHFHYFYQVITGYVVDCVDGEITIREDWNSNTYSQKQIDTLVEAYSTQDEYPMVCGDVQSELYNNELFGYYYSFVNGNMSFGLSGDHLKDYITTVYGRYSTKSYFCINGGYGEYRAEAPKVSDESLVEREDVLHTSSASTTDDIMDFYRFKAVNDGKLSVFANDVEYKLEIKDGIFSYASDTEEAVKGDVNGDGILGVSDAVTLQNGLLGAQPLKYSENIDLCKDGVIDVYDLCLLKQMIVDIPEENVSAELSVNMIGYSDKLLKKAYSDNSSAVITSTEQLKDYLTSITDEGNASIIEFYTSKYNDSFFAENVMLANCIYQSCGGGIMYKINSVSRKGDTIIVKYSDNYELEPYIDIVNGLFATAIISKDDYNSENVIWDKLIKKYEYID